MLKLAFFNLFRRKLRSLLCILGIVIGVTIIIVLVSVVDGAEKQFNDTIAQFQGIMVQEKDAVDNTLSVIDEDYAQKIKRIEGVRNVVKEIYFLPTKIDDSFVKRSDLSFIFVYGIDPQEFSKLKGNGLLGELEKGSMLNANDKDYIVIGKSFADKFNKFINSTVKIEQKKFKVKGILKSENELMGNVIVMHIDSARELSSFPEKKISSIFVELNDISQDKKIADKINFQFSEIEALTTNDFSEQINSVMGNFRLVVFVVAAISALIAAIGIINTMLMSVMERKAEIGTLKAVGWTNSNIILMIMLESIFLGIIGGIIGIIFGFLGSIALSNIIGIKSFISIALIIQAFGFAFVLSLIAGIYPAITAAKLQPVEAIRVG